MHLAIHPYLLLKTQKITSTGSGKPVRCYLQAQILTLLYHTNSIKLPAEFSVVDRDLGYSQNQMLRKEQIFLAHDFTFKITKHSSLGMYQ